MAGRAIDCADRAPLPSQALAAPCGDFHLTQLLAGGTDTGPSLPATLPVGPGGCGGGGDPPPPPPDGSHWVTRRRHLDHLGSLRLMTDESGWVVSGSQIDYYPFGMPMDAMPPSPWLFTGHEKDAATGLDYMLARMHSASVGSFTSVDPTHRSVSGRAPDTWNRYAYVGNNPMGRVDPTGGVPRPPGSGGVRPQALPPTSGNHLSDSTVDSEKEQDIQSFDGRNAQAQKLAEFLEQLEKGTFLLDGAATATGENVAQAPKSCGPACVLTEREVDQAFLHALNPELTVLADIDELLEMSEDEPPTASSPEPYVILAGKSYANLTLVDAGVLLSGLGKEITVPVAVRRTSILVVIHGHPTGNGCPSCAPRDMAGAPALRNWLQGSRVREVHTLIIPRGEGRVTEYDGETAQVLVPRLR